MAGLNSLILSSYEKRSSYKLYQPINDYNNLKILEDNYNLKNIYYKTNKVYKIGICG